MIVIVIELIAVILMIGLRFIVDFAVKLEKKNPSKIQYEANMGGANPNSEFSTEMNAEIHVNLFSLEERETSIPLQTELMAKESTDIKELEMIDGMPIEDKVAQLFIVTPEALTNVEGVTVAGETTRMAIDKFPVGGLVYFNENILSEEQCFEMVGSVQKYSIDRIGLPMLICIDEEGGEVTRIAGRGIPNVPDIPAMYYIGESGDTAAAYLIGNQIGEYLSRFGINVDFAPVADIFSNESNSVIGRRAFGKTPELVAQMVSSMVRGLKKHNIGCTLKHFPGHGDTIADSHYGEVYSYKSLDELQKCEFIPFKAGIKAGADIVMVGHISLPNILEDNTPASLSYSIITEVLRNMLGFEGVVITDALNMGAITDKFNSADAAINAINAGADIILMPEDFIDAYNGVLDAINKGIIDEKRVDESLFRILNLKKQLEL